MRTHARTLRPYAEDLDLWLRILDRGNAIVSPRVVVRYRRHADQKSQQGDSSRATQLRIVLAYADRPWWSPRLLDAQRTFRAWDALRAARRRGDRAAALAEARWLAAAPARWRALGELLVRRGRVRRASRRLDVSGWP